MEIKTIGVVGAGKMGNGIALSAAMAGYQVVLQNRTAANLVKAKNSIGNQLQKLIQKNVVTQEESAAITARVHMTSTFEKFDALDFVIEVVAESLDLKTAIFAQLDTMCKKEAILVSGTSTFSITALAAATQRPAQVAGMHFFIPPTKLVEISRGHYTSDETVDQAKSVAKQMDRVCVEVKKDSPGFIANRIYTPLFLEAFKAYEEGLASKEDIDLAMKSSYLPIGPFELADIIGLDVLKSGLDYYQSELGPSWSPPRSLKQLIRAGRLGKKVGKGWYDY
ncbi:MAG: 3-hydroxyacyl-CoA dehydrogenase family protein [Thermodesulfobacteriota bacterium]|jgi:3-hydroxybutyryl-CoA dehydrogenase